MMLRTVGSGKSFFGCGTVTFPGLVACLNWWCEPTTCTKNHPSALSCLIISALFMPRFYTQIHNQPAFTQVLSTDCNRAVTPQAPAALAIMRPLKSMLLVERDGNDERGQRDAARPQAAGHPVALGVQHPAHLRHRGPDGRLASGLHRQHPRVHRGGAAIPLCPLDSRRHGTSPRELLARAIGEPQVEFVPNSSQDWAA